MNNSGFWIAACLWTGMNDKVVNNESEHDDEEEEEDDNDDDDDDDDGLDLSLFPTVHDPSRAVSAPEENDVICGRGKSVSHPGNLKFRQMVMDRKDEYMQAKRREEKTRIATEIVVALRSGTKPSRFLLKNVETNQWFDVGEIYAREKVSHALRSRPNEERRRRLRPKKKVSRKAEIPLEFKDELELLIQSQQKLLKDLINQSQSR